MSLLWLLGKRRTSDEVLNAGMPCRVLGTCIRRLVQVVRRINYFGLDVQLGRYQLIKKIKTDIIKNPLVRFGCAARLERSVFIGYWVFVIVGSTSAALRCKW